MITLKDIYLQNFMSISELSMNFEEDTIIAITGENGSGKSALLYAIAFAITGYRYGESYRSYVKTGTDSAKILLNAVFKGYPINYDIEIMSPNKKVTPPVRRKVTYKDKVYLNSEYDQFIKEHKLNEVESLMCIFGDQHNDIINTKPGDRADTLKKIFKIDFSNIVKVFKETQEELKIKNIETAAKINELNSRIFEKQILIRTLSEKGLEDKKSQLYNVNLDLSNIANVDESSIKKYDDWLKSTNQSLNKEKERLKEDISNKFKYEKDIEESIEKINSIRKEEDIKIELENLDNEKSSINKKIEDLNINLREKTSETSVLEFNVNEFKKQIAVCETGICHACGHKIDKEHTDNIKKELLIAQENFQVSQKIVNNIKNQIKNLKDNVTSINKSINNLKIDLDTKSSEQRKIEIFKTRLDNTIASIDDRSRNIERLSQDKERIENEKKELDKLRPLLEQRKELEATKESLETLIRKTENDRIRNEEKRTTNKLVEAEQLKRDETVKNLVESQNNDSLKLGTIKQCIEVFDNLFPNYIILQACAQLEEYINSIIQRMFPYMRVSLKLNRSGVNFYYIAESSDTEWLSVKMASKAQKRSLSLAYQIALAKMYGLNCILIDEADDSMSDESARTIYNFISKLRDFQQILFISHRQESLDVMMNSDRDNIVMYKVAHGEYEQV